MKSLMSDNFCVVVDVVSCRDDDDLGGAKAETPPTASRHSNDAAIEDVFMIIIL